MCKFLKNDRSNFTELKSLLKPNFMNEYYELLASMLLNRVIRYFCLYNFTLVTIILLININLNFQIQ